MTAKPRRRTKAAARVHMPRVLSPAVAAWYAYRPTRPAAITAPWASTYTLGSHGLYDDPATGAVLSYGALMDRIVRHREHGRPDWRVTPGGRRWLPAGDRIGVLWPAWRAGHLSVDEPGGAWLLENASFDLARIMVEQWAETRDPSGSIDEQAVAARLDN